MHLLSPTSFLASVKGIYWPSLHSPLPSPRLRHLLIGLVAISGCFILMLTQTANAQPTSIGIKAGPAWTQFGKGSGEAVLGFRAGGFLTYSISQDYGVSGELNVARKGQTNTLEQRLALDYLEVPLMAYYFFGKGDFRVKAMVGPYVAYLLQAKRNDLAINSFNNTDYGAILGLGFHQSLGNRKWLNADIRYTHGLAEISQTGDLSNRDLSINLGISFPLILPN